MYVGKCLQVRSVLVFPTASSLRMLKGPTAGGPRRKPRAGLAYLHGLPGFRLCGVRYLLHFVDGGQGRLSGRLSTIKPKDQRRNLPPEETGLLSGELALLPAVVM